MKNYTIEFERSNKTKGKDVFTSLNEQEAVKDFYACYRHDTYKILSITESN